MFYNDNPGQDLRFGDVLKGFVATSPEFKIPSSEDPPAWRLKVTQARHFVVLSPCCSIDRGCLLLAPLLKIRPSFLTNPHLSEDLTRINAPVPADKSLAPTAWNGLPETEKAKRLAVGDGLIVLECFVYAPHACLGSYQLPMKAGSVDQSAYLVDFGTTFRMECDAVSRDKPAPPGTKVLELSIETRKLLRSKIAAYFARVPDEDLVGIRG
jgi:hypothetical protein